MPTSRNVTPQRILPFVLTIPLILLLLSVRMAGTGEITGVFSGNGASGLSNRLPLPIPWEDDVMATGLPVPEPDGKRTDRKVQRVRVPAVDRPVAHRRGFRPGPAVHPPRIMDSLSESLVLSRPPPAVAHFDGHGGSDGNDHIHHFLS